jgi:hypothetical protein
MPEELQTTDEVTEQQESVTTETETPDEVVDITSTDEVEGTPTGEPAEPASPEVQPEPQAEPYKEKFVHSQRESILNHERVKVANAQIEQLTKQDTPTDDAMRQLYPSWDELNDITKTALIKTEAAEMRARKIEVQQQAILDRQSLEDQLEEVMDKPEFGKLRGREAEFKRFAMKKENRGISAETLIRAFLFDGTEDTPTPPPSEPAPPAPKAEGLPVGSGGPRGDLKPKKISLEEASKIRETDNKRYMELVKAGQIEEDDI